MRPHAGLIMGAAQRGAAAGGPPTADLLFLALPNELQTIANLGGLDRVTAWGCSHGTGRALAPVNGSNPPLATAIGGKVGANVGGSVQRCMRLSAVIAGAWPSNVAGGVTVYMLTSRVSVSGAFVAATMGRDSANHVLVTEGYGGNTLCAQQSPSGGSDVPTAGTLVTSTPQVYGLRWGVGAGVVNPFRAALIGGGSWAESNGAPTDAGGDFQVVLGGWASTNLLSGNANNYAINGTILAAAIYGTAHDQAEADAVVTYLLGLT